MSEQPTLTVDPTADPLSELMRSDPRLGLLAQVLAQRQSAESSVAEGRVELLRQRSETFRQRFRDLLDRADDLRGRLDTLAAALGACAECWGGDPECTWCRGRGRPGFALPEPQSFEQLVLPAVRMAHRPRIAENGKPIANDTALEG